MPILALQQRNKVIVFHVTFGSQKSKDQWLATKISFCKTYIFNNSPKHSRHIQSTMLLVDFSYISATTSKFPYTFIAGSRSLEKVDFQVLGELL